ncbi:MAG: hypothetical protein HQ483_18305 [Rhodospirillales bacterium]|nr:hypothetical protein [Rhodospirillales bacterium]
MAKRRRSKQRVEVALITPERAKKPDVVQSSGGNHQIKSYGERLFARSVIDQRQLDAWNRIEYLAERAEYHGRPRGSHLDGIGGGVEIGETEHYIRARQTLSRLFAALGLMGTSTIEFMVIMGEDAETYADRVPGWNRHKILGGLCIALDIAANVLGIGYREQAQEPRREYH